MKKFMKTVKIVGIGLFALTVTGCSTLDHTSVEKWQGKVWRGLVEKTILDSTEERPTNKAWLAATNFDINRDVGMRMARVHFAAGWDSVLANAVVPDNVEFADIPRGTLVDIVTETGPNMDYSAQRYTRIVRVVCAAADQECLGREKAAKRIGAVIDEAPLDVNAKFGLTFNRRTSKEDVEKYK